jgi:hypothetical protein
MLHLKLAQQGTAPILGLHDETRRRFLKLTSYLFKYFLTRFTYLILFDL